MKSLIFKKFNLNTLLLIALILVFSCSNDSDGETPPVDETVLSLCENGFAGIYPCDGYDLIAHISADKLGGSSGNDSWGWTDPQTNKEYALVGLDNGTAFIDVSDPINPVYLGKLPTHTQSSTWRDVKTYNNHAFVVSEASGHGMQVFDLTRLRDVVNPPLNFTEDAHYNGFGSAHNIIINEERILKALNK
jgi:choice-of-anchor B domain-containing protein